MTALRTIILVTVGILGLASPQRAVASDHLRESLLGRSGSRFERERVRPARVRHADFRADRYRGRIDRIDCRHRTLRCDCVEEFREGYYRTIVEEACEPGYYESRWVPGCYETRIVFGCKIRFEVSSGHYKKVWHPPVVRTVERQVWVPGGWVVSRRCHAH